MKKNNFPDKISGYFRAEWIPLTLITISGLIYNVGLLAGPWFEGKLAGTLLDILYGSKGFVDMAVLAVGYIVVTALVQGSRFIKRFYVRRFANNVDRSMKRTLYANLTHKSGPELAKEGSGNLLTKAISDVGDCAEGMRKFTTEVFDTGVAMVGYIVMLIVYDPRLALISLIFPPVAYIAADRMKKIVQKTGSDYKKQAGKLNAATLDRATNALTYRVYGCDMVRRDAYEKELTAYEKSAVKANIPQTALTPLYGIVSMLGAVTIIYFGAKNVLGNGFTTWDIAAFTTFLSCYSKLATKSSKAAKLVNSVQKAEVSWKRIKPLMKAVPEDNDVIPSKPDTLSVRSLSFTYPDGKKIFEGLDLAAEPGGIIGVTGPVACGKSTLGRTFLCEYPYSGSIKYGGKELSEMPEDERRGIVAYLGHAPELMSDSIENNVLMSDEGDIWKALRFVSLDKEVSEMPEGVNTKVGSGGVRLSGGQAQRLALARTIFHSRPLTILDDPFSALDRNTEAEIYERLEGFAKDRTVILISHRLGMFPKMRQVIWMDEGKTITSTHEELMRTVPAYRELFESETKGVVTGEEK